MEGGNDPYDIMSNEGPDYPEEPGEEDHYPAAFAGVAAGSPVASIGGSPVSVLSAATVEPKVSATNRDWWFVAEFRPLSHYCRHPPDLSAAGGARGPAQNLDKKKAQEARSDECGANSPRTEIGTNIGGPTLCAARNRVAMPCWAGGSQTHLTVATGTNVVVRC